MARIIAISVYYNPDYDVIKGLESFCRQVDYTVIVDNSERSVDELYNIIKKTYNLKIIENKENRGIATALNQGLQYAVENGYEYALLIDQDSKLFPETVNKLRKCLESDERIFIACPQRIDVNSATNEKSTAQYKKILTCVTSGSLLRLKHVKEVGYHEEKLFIDMVDHEYCLRASSMGLQVVIVNDALMRHRLGMMCRKIILGVNFYPTNHSAIRRYYKARNSFYVWRRYGLKYPKFVLRAIVNFIIEYLEIVLFEDDKLGKTIAILNGFYDCVRQRFGKKRSSSKTFRG